MLFFLPIKTTLHCSAEEVLAPSYTASPRVDIALGRKDPILFIFMEVILSFNANGAEQIRFSTSAQIFRVSLLLVRE